MKKDTKKKSGKGLKYALGGLAALAAAAAVLAVTGSAKASPDQGTGDDGDLNVGPGGDLPSGGGGVNPEPSRPNKRNAPDFDESYEATLERLGAIARGRAKEYNDALIAEMNLEDGFTGPPPRPTAAEANRVRAQFGIPAGMLTRTWIANEAYAAQFPDITIPPPSKRGSGWQPHIDLWVALSNIAKNNVMVPA